MQIGIFGDSWGSGVWGYSDGKYYNQEFLYDENKTFEQNCEQLVDSRLKAEYTIVHLGIQHYFWKKNNHGMPHNFSKPAASNTLSIQYLKRYHQDFDINIFIVTEPFRDFFFRPDLYDTNKTLKQNCEQLVDAQLKEIETLCGESCIVVGGLHKISKNYNFMHSVNWCELIDSKAHWPVYYADAGQLGQKLKQNEIIINGPKIKEVILDADSNDRYRATMKILPKYFTPCYHPNILGHELLYKEIATVVNASFHKYVLRET
jgi:hypothetical protein